MKGSMKSFTQINDAEEAVRQQVQKEEIIRSRSRIFGSGAKMLDRNSLGTLSSLYSRLLNCY